jgi:hypothetical protein
LSVTDGWGETAEVSDAAGVLDPDRLPGFVRPDGDPRSVPADFDCPAEGFERHPQVYDGDVNWGSGGGAGAEGGSGLELRVVDPADGDGGSDGGDGSADEATTFARGDDVRFELTNVAGRERHTGNRQKYNVEVYTEAGWIELRGTDGEPVFDYTDEAISHPPGETAAWEFTLTESGLVEDDPHPADLHVCPDLVPGRYRFVFWGAADIAVAFDYEG